MPPLFNSHLPLLSMAPSRYEFCEPRDWTNCLLSLDTASWWSKALWSPHENHLFPLTTFSSHGGMVTIPILCIMLWCGILLATAHFPLGLGSRRVSWLGTCSNPDRPHLPNTTTPLLSREGGWVVGGYLLHTVFPHSVPTTQRLMWCGVYLLDASHYYYLCVVTTSGP